MQKKHQIFISSTFSDLKLERQAAVEAILAAGHIPAGMELFAAGDESQMDVIKRWIDDSDIYMLILGGRYGSIDPQTGLSYTEIEYDYAIEKGKPFFSLVLHEQSIDAKADELDQNHREILNQTKYIAFRGKVLSKISKVIEDCKDIKIGVLESIRFLEGKYSLQGWVRSNEFPNVAPLIKQLENLSKENSSLKKQLEAGRVANIEDENLELATLDDKISIRYVGKTRRSSGYGYFNDNNNIAISWGSLFGLIAPILLSGQSDDYMQSYICKQLIEYEEKSYDLYTINEQDFHTIKIHLMALNLISTDYSKTVGGGAALFWNLTPIGKTTMLKLRAARK